MIRWHEHLLRWRLSVVGTGHATQQVHFNGSVNLPDTETVMREISSRIPARCEPNDGRGDRGARLLDPVPDPEVRPDARVRARVRRAGVRDVDGRARDGPVPARRRRSADTIEWPNLGYADAYASSFEVFDRLQQEGTIPADVRMQVQYPTPLASMAGTIVARGHARRRRSVRGGAVRRPRRSARRAFRTTASRCSGTSPSSSACSRAPWAPRPCRWSRSCPAWFAAPTGCPTTSPSACTSATATTATSTSSSRSRCGCRSTS